LYRLQEQIESIKKLANADRHYILWNFYFSAERYAKNDQHDIAALLYYRTIESIFENALQDIASGFDRSNPDFSLFGMGDAEVHNKFFAFRNTVFKKPAPQEELPTTIAL